MTDEMIAQATAKLDEFCQQSLAYSLGVLRAQGATEEEVSAAEDHLTQQMEAKMTEAVEQIRKGLGEDGGP